MAGLASLKRSAHELSWGETTGACGDRVVWGNKVGSMTESYVSFLRGGIKCSCGSTLHQAARCAAVFRSTTPHAMATSRSAGDDMVDLTDDAPACAVKPGASETIDLSNDEDLMASIYGPSQPAPMLHCQQCVKTYCAACGECTHGGQRKAGAGAGDSDSMEHARACHLRWVHSVACAVENLRKVKLNISAVMDEGAPKRIRAAHATASTLRRDVAGKAKGPVKAKAKSKLWSNAAAMTALKAMPGVGAGSSEAQPVPKTGSVHGWMLADRALQASFAIAVGRYARAAASSTSAFEGSVHLDSLPPFLTPSIVESLLGPAGAVESNPQMYSMQGGYDDESDYDGEESEYGTTQPAYQAAAAGKGGAGYAGSAQDGAIMKTMKEEARRRRAVEDAEMAMAVRALQDALPRAVFDSRTGQGTDGASDHPLLLQMLTGPGFADGLHVLLPVQPVGDETVQGAGACPSASAGAGSKSSSIIMVDDEVEVAAALPAVRKGRGRKRGVDEVENAAVPQAPKRPAPAPGPSSARSTAPDAEHGPSLPTVSGIAIPASDKKVGAGDGLFGGSVLYALLNELLRTSVMDMATDESRRTLFFAVLHLLQHIGMHTILAGFLVYTPPSEPAGVGAGAGGSSGKVPKAPHFSAWLCPQGILEEEVKPSEGASSSSSSALHVVVDEDAPVAYKLMPSKGCVSSLLEELKSQAVVYKKRTVTGDAAPEVLMGSSDESNEYTAVLGLCVDVEDGAGKVTESVGRWGRAHIEWLELVMGGVREEDEVGYTGPERTAVAGPAKGGKSKKKVTLPAMPTGAIAQPGAKSASGALADPAVEGNAGMCKVAYTPSASTEREYLALMREECFYSLQGLKKEHAYRAGVAAAGGGYTSSSAMTAISNTGTGNIKRHMQVSAEMASLVSGNVNWHSSILVRSDEADSDCMRAVITGPPDTPYAGGFYLFDVFLPPTYPVTAPNVKFLTTGGGTVRFNPNLYAEGKVCLSLLGTWSGPGWVSGTSTLNQVLVSVQSQIMNEMPFGNEPGHEAILGTPQGKRSVAKHNCAIRLANMRHAMLDVIKKPPTGFERASKAHFFYKRDELKALTSAWALEVQSLAVYEAFLVRRVEALRKVCAPLWELEYETYCKEKAGKAEEAKKKAEEARKKADEDAKRAAAVAAASAPPGGKGKKKAKPSYDYGGHAAYSAAYSSAMSMAQFKPSSHLKKGLDEYDVAYRSLTKWWSETSASSHEVFQNGMGAGTASASSKEKTSYCIEAILAGTDALAPAQRVQASLPPSAAPKPALSFPAYGLAPMFNPVASGAVGGGSAAQVQPGQPGPWQPSLGVVTILSNDPYGYGASSSSTAAAAASIANQIYVSTGTAGMYYGGGYGSYSGMSAGTTTFQYTVNNPHRTKWFDIAASTMEVASALSTAMDAIKKEDLESDE